MITAFSKQHTIIHTGQHYDFEMSEIFFREFNLPKPDFNLEVGSASPAFQIGEIIKKLEKILLRSDYNLAIVYGDTNSTLAGALGSKKMGIKVAHVEAGLRSFDMRMPEEINRILTDHLSDYLFAPTETATKNLKREHVMGKIIYTGDIAVETVNTALKFSSRSSTLKDLGIKSKSFVLFTMHRAENTAEKKNFISIIHAFESLSEIQIVFPIHPRTRKILQDNNLYNRLVDCKNVRLIQPLGYTDFLKLMQSAKKIITDSGGVQKEAYLLSVPCITIRRNTEWVETVDAGWNILTDFDSNKIIRATREWTPPKGKIKPIFGDGRTSKIIKNSIKSLMRQ